MCWNALWRFGAVLVEECQGRGLPGGSAWRYLQVSPPLGQIQNHPYSFFSMASMKYLQI
jgi:hypothetical protein